MIESKIEQSGNIQHYKVTSSITEDVNETGQVQYEKFSMRTRVKRALRNWDAAIWYRKYGGK